MNGHLEMGGKDTGGPFTGTIFDDLPCWVAYRSCGAWQNNNSLAYVQERLLSEELEIDQPVIYHS